MSWSFAFLHHVTAFTLVAAVAVELVPVRLDLTPRLGRSLLAVDAVLGLSAAALLAVGLARVFFFEKGAAYYGHNVAFLAKLGLFLAVAMASIYPTRAFLALRAPIRAGDVPAFQESKLARIRTILHPELIAIVLILLSAALMAKGIGTL